MDVLDITKVVSEILGIPEGKITGKSRKHKVARARFIAVSLYRRINYRKSANLTGEDFNRSYSTIIYIESRHEESIATDPEYREDYRRCCNAFGLRVNSNISIDIAKAISNLERKIYTLEEENQSLNSTINKLKSVLLNEDDNG